MTAMDILGAFAQADGTPDTGLSVYVCLLAESAFLKTGEQVSVQEQHYVVDDDGMVVIPLIPSSDYDRDKSMLVDIVATYRIRIPSLGVTRIVAIPTTLSDGTITLDDLIDADELDTTLSDDELVEMGLL